MPGYPASPSVVTVSDTLANIAPALGNVAGYFVWLASQSTGTIYGPSAKTASAGTWSIAGVPLGVYNTFYGPEAPATGNVPTRWQAPGVTNYVVSSATSVYIPPGGFPIWTAALASAKTGGVAPFWGMGASLAPLGGGGTAITDMLVNPYGVLYRQRLINAGYPIAGDTFLPSASSDVTGGYNRLVTYSVPPWVMDVAPAAWQFDGMFTMPIWNTQTTMPLCHAIHPSTALGYNARSVRFWYFDVGNQDGATSIVGRQFDVTETVDSVTQSPTMLGDNLIHSIDFNNLSNSASHRLNFGNQRTAAFCMFPIMVSWSTATTYSAQTGVHYAWFGQPGSHTLHDMARTDGTAPKLRIERLLGPNNTPTGDPPSAPFASGSLGPPFGPKMVWIDEYDDFAFVGVPTNSGSTPIFTVNAADPGKYRQGLQRLLNIVRGADVVHYFPAIPDSYVSDVTIGNNQQWSIEQYYMIRKQEAELRGQGWMNIDQLIGETGLAKGYLQAANPHLTNAGQAFVDAQNQARFGF